MRTDAKIGFAIVGVLVLVLIVYALVIPKGSKTNRQANATPVPAKVPADEPGGVQVPPSGTDVPGGDGTLTIPPRTVDPVRPPVGPDAGRTGADPLHNNTNNTGGTDADHNRTAPPPGPRHEDVAGDNRHPVPPVASAKTYKVKAGDSLGTIAAAQFGTTQAWHQIAELNPTVKPERLRVGTVLTLPDASAVHARVASAAGREPAAREPAVRTRGGTVIAASDIEVLPPADVTGLPTATDGTGATYVIKKNDSLYQIARRRLGSGHRADELYDLNRDTIGADPTRLKVGMVLRLPAAPGGLLSDAALR